MADRELFPRLNCRQVRQIQRISLARIELAK